MQVLRATDPHVLDMLSYVIASGQREKVLAAVLPGPKTPAQVARETGLRLPHVSRALSQLVKAGLVHRLTRERRGKLCIASDLGRAVFDELSSTRGDRVVAPMARGNHLRNYHHWVSKHFGTSAADALFREVGLDARTLDRDRWYPLRTTMQILERIEARFGDGRNETARRMLREEAVNFPSIKRFVLRHLPLAILIEMAPNVYAREFNHGRLEVEVDPDERRALMKNFDWMSSPARCAAWLGTYEGALALAGQEGTVRKVACILEGAPYCGYTIEW